MQLLGGSRSVVDLHHAGILVVTVVTVVVLTVTAEGTGQLALEVAQGSLAHHHAEAVPLGGLDSPQEGLEGGLHAEVEASVSSRVVEEVGERPEDLPPSASPRHLPPGPDRAPPRRSRRGRRNRGSTASSAPSQVTTW